MKHRELDINKSAVTWGKRTQIPADHGRSGTIQPFQKSSRQEASGAGGAKMQQVLTHPGEQSRKEVAQAGEPESSTRSKGWVLPPRN